MGYMNRTSSIPIRKFSFKTKSISFERRYLFLFLLSPIISLPSQTLVHSYKLNGFQTSFFDYDKGLLTNLPYKNLQSIPPSPIEKIASEPLWAQKKREITFGCQSKNRHIYTLKSRKNLTPKTRFLDNSREVSGKILSWEQK